MAAKKNTTATDAATAGKNLAKANGLTEIDTVEAVDKITDDLLYIFHASAKKAGNKEVVKKLEKVFQKYHSGGKIVPGRRKPVFLIGPPGHGKTTSFKVAAKRLADELGMRVLVNSEIEEALKEGPITKNDLVFVSQETAGVLSTIEWMGLPTREKDANQDREHMGRLYSRQLLALKDAGCGVLLLDDLMSANRAIQDAALGLLEEGRYVGLSLENVYIAATGNLGKLDGTNASQMTAAMRNRVRLYYTQDTPKNFDIRVSSNPMFRDEVGDAGVLGFLERHPEMFFSMPDPKQRGGYNTPRSWYDFMELARQIAFAGGGRQGLLTNHKEITTEASSMLGAEVAHNYATYLKSMMDQADPLARQVINEGKLNIEAFQKKFEGYSGKSQDFIYQYAHALADYTALKVVEDKGDLTTAVQRFGTGLSVVPGSAFTFAINAFSSKLANSFDDLSDKSMGENVLRMEAKYEIVRIFTKQMKVDGILDETQISDVIECLSNNDKASDLRAKRKRRR